MKRAQKGFGLIEVMISLVIGMVLLLGISAILVSMTRTGELRRKMGEVQGGQRLAMTLVGNGLRYAGSFPYAPADTAASVFPIGGVFGAGQSIVGSGAGANADTVSVRFIASTSVTASQGCSVNLIAGNSYTNVYSVSGGYLKCVETNTTANTAPVTVNLIAGLTGMNLLYGVDTTGGGFVTQYRKASEITPPAMWDAVKTIKVNLIFANPLVGDAGQAGKPTVSITQTIPHPIGL